MVSSVCCGQLAEVIGLRRLASAPTYQSNCFIRNDESRTGRIVVTLASGIGDLIASAIIDLQPNEFVRLLQVFATLHGTGRL
jgi:hypothetical protein